VNESRILTVAAAEARSALRRPLWWLLVLGAVVTTLSLSSTAALPSGDGPSGPIEPYANSVHALSFFFGLSGFLLFGFFASVLGGMSVIRDDEHRVVDLIHATPLTAEEYVTGKLAGVGAALGVALVVQVCALAGFYEVLGAGGAVVGPFDLVNYAYPVVAFALPALFGFAGLAFAVGARTRQPLSVMVVPALLVFSLPFFLTWSPPWLGAVGDGVLMTLDPSGLRWYLRVALAPGLSVTEVNSGAIPYDGLLLLNRMIWVGATAFLVWRARRWVGPAGGSRGRAAALETSASGSERGARSADPQFGSAPEGVASGAVAPGMGARTPPLRDLEMVSRRARPYRTLAALVATELRGARRQPLLWGLTALLVGLVWSEGAQSFGPFGEPLIRTSGGLATQLFGTLSFAMCTVLLFVVVEGLHRGRVVGVHEVEFATPTPTWVLLASRPLAALGVCLAMVGVVIVTTIPLIVVQPGGRLDLLPFLLVWGALMLPTLALWAAVTTLVYSSVRSRYTTYAIGFGLLMLSLRYLQHSSTTWVTNWTMAGTLQWSDMGPLQLDRIAIVLNRAWVATLALTTMATAIVVFRRTERDPATRTSVGVRIGRALRPVAPFAVLSGIFVVLLGAEVRAGFQGEAAREVAEKYWRMNAARWSDASLPTRSHVALEILLEPDAGRAEVAGRYHLINRHDRALTRIPFTVRPALGSVEWSVEGRGIPVEDRSGLHVVTLSPALAPGDSVRLNFSFTGTYPAGVTRNGGGTEQFVLPSGVVLHTLRDSFLPQPGFDAGIRPREALRPVPPEPSESEGEESQLRPPGASLFTTTITVDVPAAYRTAVVGHRVQSDTVAGRVLDRWVTRKPVGDISVLAGRWAERREGSTALYHLPEHDRNVEAMFDALLAARTSYSRWFHPYPWEDLKLSEVPGLTRNAIGFPTNISFSEHLGFRSQPVNGLSTAFVVTAHEVAHQWWGNLVSAGTGPGSDHLVEGMASYASLLLVDDHLGVEAGRSYRRQLEATYLSSRRVDREPAVARVLPTGGGSRAVTVDKGAWVQWMLHDVIGRERALAGLRDFVDAYSSGTSLPGLPQMLAHLRERAPDPNAFDRFVDQWFFDTILPEFGVGDLVVEEEATGWAVSFVLANRGTGDVEVDVGVRTEAGMSSRRVRISPTRDVPVRIVVPQRPSEVVVDPDVQVLQNHRDRARIRLD